MSIVLLLGLILVTGFAGGRLISLFKLPAVTGYLIVGLLLGPSVMGMISFDTIEQLAPINTIALSIIAFLIGGEFSFKLLKRCGKSAILIAIFEVLGALTFVTGILHFLLGMKVSTALILGAISSATAPAATIMVLREYKAKGPLTDNLLAVVAIDDALCLIVFGIVMSSVKAIVGQMGGSVAAMLIVPIWELLGSVLLGGVFALAFLAISQRIKEGFDKLVLILGAVFVLAGVSDLLHLSSLLACMAMGCIAINLLPRETDRVFKIVKSIDTPIYVLFFVTAGANLHLSVLAKVGIIGVVYILSRVIGKMFGAALGAKLGKAPLVVQKYLGLGLVPQAGIAIGLTQMLQQDLPMIADLVTTVVLGSVVILEIIGPFFSKMAITKAGEVGGMTK
ncbi:MAG TPA: cation:proton antiporter [Firmicutes bacterium]|nr:cation:proton antiporter [Bacillota bacterium]